MIATARLKYLGVSAQKTRLVVNLVRGKTVGDALATLRYSRKMVSKDLEKLLQSALANAQQKDPKLDVDRLVVAKATVDEGPPQKRARPRSMGRIYRILKKSSHVSIALDVTPLKVAPVKGTSVKGTPAKGTPVKARAGRAAKGRR